MDTPEIIDVLEAREIYDGTDASVITVAVEQTEIIHPTDPIESTKDSEGSPPVESKEYEETERSSDIDFDVDDEDQDSITFEDEEGDKKQSEDLDAPIPMKGDQESDDILLDKEKEKEVIFWNRIE